VGLEPTIPYGRQILSL